MEMLGQQVAGVVGFENPVVELGKQHFLSKILLKSLRFALLDDQLHGFEVLEKLVEVFVIALSDIKFAGGDIEEGDTAQFVSKMDGGEEVVLALFEHLVVDGNTGGNQFGDAAFHECFGEFWIFELFADGHTISGTHKPGQVRVKRMVREARQLRLRRTLPMSGQRDT